MQATVESALHQAGVEPEALTAVAVTAGPGLALCLQVGLSVWGWGWQGIDYKLTRDNRIRSGSDSETSGTERLRVV